MRNPLRSFGPGRAVVAGFTLMEVIISITILSLMLGVLYGAMHLGVRAWERGSSITEKFQRHRVLVDQLAQELRSAMVSVRNDKIVFLGTSQEVKFFTTTSGLHGGMGSQGMRAVRYRVKSGEGLVLHEGQAGIPPGKESFSKGKDTSLAREVRDLSFEYLSPESSRGVWLQAWDSKVKRRLPIAVRFSLRYEGDEESMPPVIVALPVNVVLRRIRQSTFAAPTGEETGRAAP